MSDHQSGYLPKSVDPKSPNTSSTRLARVNRSSNDLSSSTHSSHRGGPSSRLMNAPSAPPTKTGRLPKRSHSFKRTSMAPSANANAGADLDQLANLDSSLNVERGGPRPRSSNASIASASGTSGGSGFGTTTSTTNFVKNFLEEDFDDNDVLSPGKRQGGDGGSHSGLQFDAETQRNVHRSLLSPSTPSPGNSPESPRKTIKGGSAYKRDAHGSPQQNLFQQRDDFYNVDQSVNLMDAEAGKYESKSRSGKSGGHGGASMVEIFLKESTGVGSTGSTAKNGSKVAWWHPDRQAQWDRMTTWEKIKEIAARLVIPLFCCSIMAVVVLAIVMVYHSASGDAPKPTTPKPTSAPQEVPQAVAAAAPQQVLNAEGMTGSMQAMSQALVDLQVASADAFTDIESPAFQALDWISKDDIALNNVADTGAGRRLETNPERMVQRYVLAVAFYSWKGMTSKATDLSAAAMSNMDNLGGSVSEQGVLGITEVESIPADQLWLTAKSECTWRGVECHPHASTLQIASSKSHEGTQIRALNLTHHGLEGNVPSELTALTHLVELDLRHNALSGNLDKLNLANWKRMEYLLLGSNQLTGKIPDTLNEMERIIDIDLGDNSFSGTIPALTDGQIQLQDLENVFLDNNQLTGSIPDSFLRDMPFLGYLDVTENKLSGPIPQALGECTNLRYFRAVNNSMTGNLPGALATLERLDTLALDNNKLGGELPEAYFSGLIRLRYLQLNDNDFSGPFPESVADLEKLKNLDLSGNAFTGSIPGSLFDGEKALMSVRFSRNKLSGPVPASIGNLAATLEDFRVDENQLSGELPEEMGQLTELRFCEMSANSFTGSIPASWSGMFQLEDMHLDQNDLTGSVPADLCEAEKQNEGTDLPISITVDCESGEITCDCCEKCM